ncbi:DUF5999 family protein [Streptomyces sp. NPDC087212]|uniref:DUF5999 family protein n=1 Tax=Streptomyces sp. NPDC087212 TaxID=3365766 RepID=UPI0038014B3D
MRPRPVHHPRHAQPEHGQTLDRDPPEPAEVVVADDPVTRRKGWSLLCNGVLLFEDTGELLPDGRVINPHRPLLTGARS